MSKKCDASRKTECTGPVDISLIRGDKGLGFNIKGGIDAPHIPGDPGIFVVKLRDSGAAAEDGQLREGDKIIEVNGVNVEQVDHKEAVKLFLSSNHVNIKVIPVDVYKDKALNYTSRNKMSAYTPHGNKRTTYSDYLYLAVFFGAAYLGHSYFTKCEHALQKWIDTKLTL